jgi:AraC-like DNA-binding protein
LAVKESLMGASRSGAIVRGRRPIAEGIVRVGPVLATLPLLRARGIDPAPVLAEAGLTAACFDDPDNVIPYATLGRLVGRCARATCLADWGLRLGAEAGASSLGLVGVLVKNSPDVGSALRNLVEHLHLHDRGASPSLKIDGGMATLGYAIHHDGIEAADHIADGAIAITCNVIHGLCGAEWVPAAVTLMRREPPDTTLYHSFFRAPVRFDAEHNAVAFPVRWLAQRLPGADADLRRMLERQVLEPEINESGSVVHMRRVLRTLLHTGEATEERLAHLFAMHRRTVNRRLQSQGTTFRRLVDDVRYDVARHLLESSERPVVDIAGMLNYADASAFTRAFRRWSGTTPARWRLDRGQAKPPGVGAGT